MYITSHYSRSLPLSSKVKTLCHPWIYSHWTHRLFILFGSLFTQPVVCGLSYYSFLCFGSLASSLFIMFMWQNPSSNSSQTSAALYLHPLKRPWLQRVTQLGWLFSLYIYDCLSQTEWYLSIILFFPGPLIFYFIPFYLSSNLLSLAAPSLPADDLLHWENRSKHKGPAVAPASALTSSLWSMLCTIYCYATNYPKS